MRSFKSFQQELFRVNNQNFNDFALNLFLYQAKNNPVYAHYLSALDIEPKQVKTIEQIPCLPVSFFKRHRITTESWKEKIVYESSGTTGLNVSRHYVREEKFYLENCEKTFAHFYGPLWNYHMLFLLPGYMERGNSSLVSMANYFAKCTKSSYSGFYLHNYDDLLKTIDKIKKRKDSRKVVLCGVSFALMDLA
ncbi:MAG: acyl transferase, partial [Bacteroidota bacterium]